MKIRSVLFLLLILACSIVVLAGFKIGHVQADTNDETYHTVYYFTDADPSLFPSKMSYYEDIISEANDIAYHGILNFVWWETLLPATTPDDQPTPFYDKFINWQPVVEEDGIFHCAYVIFELTQGFRGIPDDVDGDSVIKIFIEKMDAFFCQLENYGTPVIFICDTDESRFYYGTSFLDHVKVHINTDLDTPMIDSFLRHTENDMPGDESDISSTNIFLDAYYSQDYFIKDYFIPYFIQVYPNHFNGEVHELSTVKNYNSTQITSFFSALLTAVGVRFIGTTIEGSFIDFATGQIYSPSNFTQVEDLLTLYEYDPDDDDNNWYAPVCRIRALGSTYYNSSDDFTFRMLGLSYPDYDVKIYLNISNPAIWLEDYEEEENVYTLGAAVASLPTTIESIIRGVIAFGDLEEYDIWPGVCDCTYKPIIIGDGGWVYIPCRFLTNWQYISEEEAITCEEVHGA